MINKVKELLDNGYSVNKIARHLKLNEYQVRKIINTDPILKEQSIINAVKGMSEGGKKGIGQKKELRAITHVAKN